MEGIDDHLRYLREMAAHLRRLARDYAVADHHLIAAKLTEVAAEFEAKAAALERHKHACAA